MLVGSLIDEIGLSFVCDHMVVVDVEDDLLNQRLKEKNGLIVILKKI